MAEGPSVYERAQIASLYEVWSKCFPTSKDNQELSRKAHDYWY